MKSSHIRFLSISTTLLSAAASLAERKPAGRAKCPAISRAVDLADDLAGDGGAVELEVGYRIAQKLAVPPHRSISCHDNGPSLVRSSDALGR